VGDLRRQQRRLAGRPAERAALRPFLALRSPLLAPRAQRAPLVIVVLGDDEGEAADCAAGMGGTGVWGGRRKEVGLTRRRIVPTQAASGPAILWCAVP
jgi:hypothetical protein